MANSKIIPPKVKPAVDENNLIGDEDNPETLLPSFAKKKNWTNRERVLILSTRGVSYRDRHLMNDLKTLMPHSKTESKIDKKEKTVSLNEVAEMRNCTKCIFFEARKRQDLYVWFSNIERGPSAKFLVQNVHTSGELKLSGNCLQASRPILSFDKQFDEQPHYQLLKELFIQMFSTPNHHPKSQPFIDHVFNFSIEDKRIWFRNYQIVDETTKKLEEIGPRMVLQVIKIFEGSFGGPILYENADYICPNTLRRQRKFSTANKYVDKVRAKTHLNERRVKEPRTFKSDPIFDAVYGGGSSAAAAAADQPTAPQQENNSQEIVVVDPVLSKNSEFARIKRKIDAGPRKRKVKKQKKS